MTKTIFIPSGDLNPLPPALKQGYTEFHRPEYNSLGYMSDEFDKRKSYNIMFAGCSWTFGDGVSDQERWTSIVANKMSASQWNFGSPGSSNDYIARTCLTATNHLKPDLVLVLFTRHVRREYISHNKCLKYIASWRKWGSIKEWPIANRILKSFDTLSSEENDIANLYWNYKFTESYLNQLGVNWLFSWIPSEKPRLRRYGEIDDVIEGFVDPNRNIGKFHNIDIGSDGWHPGPISHSMFADKVLDKFNKNLTSATRPAMNYHDPFYCYKEDDIFYRHSEEETKDPIVNELKQSFSIVNSTERETIHNMKMKWAK